MFSEKKNIYSFTELFNGNYSIQGCFDIAVAEQDAPADLVCADLAVVHPVGERHERDAQTVGGYPRIGHVVACDLGRAAQLRPGESVHFEPIDLRQARALSLGHQHRLARVRLAIAQRL